MTILGAGLCHRCFLMDDGNVAFKKLLLLTENASQVQMFENYIKLLLIFPFETIYEKKIRANHTSEIILPIACIMMSVCLGVL